MYRLLIVTEDPNAQSMFAAMEGWEALGFKPPRVRTSVREAVECMSKHHIDAVAVEQSPSFDDFLSHLDEQYPNVPLFQIASTPEEQRELVHEVYRLLTRLSADDSNYEYDQTSLLCQQRDRWLHKVISGMIPTEADMARQLRLYRCTEKLDVPCVLARLEFPQDDHFLSERWHYGSERLETALRNFFGRGHDHMLTHVAVVSTEEVRVLCYPEDEQEGVSENAAFGYVQETAEQIDHYLGLSMKVLDVRRLSGLKAFAAENAAL